MMSVLVASIVIRVLALIWTLVAARRLREWRVLYLSAVLALMSLQQVLTLRTLAVDGLGSAAAAIEVLGLLVSILVLVAAIQLPKTLLAERETRGRLRQLEARYRDLFEEAPLAYVITHNRDGDPIIEECNRTFLALTGYERSEAVGRPLADFYTKRSRSSLRQEGGYERALKGEFGKAERQLLTKDGQVVETLLRAMPERSPCGLAVGTRAIFTDITDHKLAQRKLRRSRERLRKLAARLEAVREEERSFIAREIHDELGQRLTGLKLDLSWLSGRLASKDTTRLAARVHEMIRLVDRTMEAVRDLSSHLRPPVLDDLGLVPAIEWQAGELGRRFALDCNLDLPTQELELDPQRTTALFRIFQEAMTNVCRHAKATQVDISLRTLDGSHLLEIVDNGSGIDEQLVWQESSLGLIGMRERAGALGGRVQIRARPQGGTKVAVRVPA